MHAPVHSSGSVTPGPFTGGRLDAIVPFSEDLAMCMAAGLCLLLSGQSTAPGLFYLVAQTQTCRTNTVPGWSASVHPDLCPAQLPRLSPPIDLIAALLGCFLGRDTKQSVRLCLGEEQQQQLCALVMPERGRAEAAAAAQGRTALPAVGACAINGAAREQLFHLRSMKYLRNQLLECDKDV